MDEKTARKYRDTGKLPSELKKEHTWRTRRDPFEKDWEEIREMISKEPGLEALTIFQYLQREAPGKSGLTHDILKKNFLPKKGIISRPDSARFHRRGLPVIVS